MTISFKKHEAQTGLRSIGAGNRSSTIKMDGKNVGNVFYDKPNMFKPNATSTWAIQLHIKDANSGGGWKNITLKNRFETDALAKTFVSTRINDILKAFKLHSIE